MAKYDPIHEFLLSAGGNECDLTFSRIETIIGCPLPMSARKYREWWGNEEKLTHPQCRAWMTAGWKVEEGGLDFTREHVRFVRTSLGSER